MKKYIHVLVFAAVTATAVAESVITDNFDRDDTKYSRDGAVIGDKWRNDQDMEWAVQNKMVAANHNISGEYVLYNRSLETVSGRDKKFELRCDVTGMFGGAWGGIAFNYQNAGNFYMVRFQAGTSTYQLVRVVGGAVAAIVSKTDAVKQFEVGSSYTIRVTSETPYNYNFEITETGASQVLNPTTAGIDKLNRFTGGYAGLYVRSAPGSAKPDVMFDNFSMTAN